MTRGGSDVDLLERHRLGLSEPVEVAGDDPGDVARPAAARFVASRRAAHVGLTATKLEPELARSEDPRTAVYLVDLTRGAVKLVVNCRTGLVRIWVGPGTALP